MNGECRGVQGNKRVRPVARRMNIPGTEVQLKTADAGPCSGRRPNLGRKIRQGTDIVAQNGGVVSEQRPRQLDTITRITGKPDDRIVHLLELATSCRFFLRLLMGGHDFYQLRGIIVVMLI